jgi:hypothetical protein
LTPIGHDLTLPLTQHCDCRGPEAATPQPPIELIKSRRFMTSSRRPRRPIEHLGRNKRSALRH